MKQKASGQVTIAEAFDQCEKLNKNDPRESQITDKNDGTDNTCLPAGIARVSASAT